VVGLATRRALARGVLSQRRLEQTVGDLRQCVDQLSDPQQRVLTLRAGLGPLPPLSRTQVARRLDLTRGQTGRIERRGLRRLGALDGAGRCGGVAGASTAAAASLLAPAGALATSAATADVGSASQPRYGVEGVSASGGNGGPSLDDVLPPPIGDGADWTVLILLMLAAMVGLLVRRELRRR
jgi:hypothetical protein